MAITLRRLRLVLRPFLTRSYRQSSVHDAVYTVDLRSDVLTKPSPQMKEAIVQATYGDDVFDEDDSVHALQDKVAKLFGKEAALFVPSGTMGNLISVVSHCSNGKGQEVILGDQSHLMIYEQGGMAVLGGIHPRTVPNKPDGTFDVEKVRESIRPLNDPHQPLTSLICVENTHNNCGGKVVPLSFIKKLSAVSREHGLKFHIDGARLMNACVALNIQPREMVSNADSATMCISKGIGAPIGAVITGTKDFIARAVRLRKILGGGWRQPGLLAAAGLLALEDAVPRMQQDHANAKHLAKELRLHHQGVVCVDVEGVHTNMVMVHITKPGLTAADFCQRLNTVTAEEERVTGEKVKVKAVPFYKQVARLVTYSNITPDDIELALTKIKYVISEYAEVGDRHHSLLRDKLISDALVRKLGNLATESPYSEWEDLQYDLAYRR